MRHLLTILAALFLCAAHAQAQTLKSLMYNSTNGQVVYSGTNVLTFTNTLSFGTNAAATRTNLSLGATWLTNTNVTNFRTSIGLGPYESDTHAIITDGYGNAVLDTEDGVRVLRGIYFIGTNATANAATTRTNLGLGLPALINTSNVTMMRALAGSTNTNQPFSGTFDFQDFSDLTVRLTVSNGIILNIEFP